MKTSSILSISSLVVVFQVACAADSDSLPLSVIQLVPSDFGTMTPERVIKECSDAIIRMTGCESRKTADLYLRRAKAYFELGQYQSAGNDLDHFLKLRPSDPEGRCRRVGVLFQVGKPREGMAEIHSIIKDHPHYAPAYAILAAAYGQQKDYKMSIKFNTAAIRIDDSFELSYYNRAIAYFYLKEYNKALDDINKSIELIPFRSSQRPECPYILRGDLLRKLGRSPQAIVNYVIARRLNPRSHSAFIGLWEAYHTLGKNSLCCVIAEDFTSTCPKQSIGYDFLARSFVEIGRFEDALRVGKQALELDKKDTDTMFLLAKLCVASANYKDALNYLNLILRLDEMHLEASLLRIVILSGAHDSQYRDGLKATKSAFALCARTENKDARCLLGLARAKAECGNFESAIEMTQRAIDLLPREAAARKSYEMELELYKERKPFRFPMLSPKEGQKVSPEKQGVGRTSRPIHSPKDLSCALFLTNHRVNHRELLDVCSCYADQYRKK